MGNGRQTPVFEGQPCCIRALLDGKQFCFATKSHMNMCAFWSLFLRSPIGIHFGPRSRCQACQRIHILCCCAVKFQ